MATTMKVSRSWLEDKMGLPAGVVMLGIVRTDHEVFEITLDGSDIDGPVVLCEGAGHNHHIRRLESVVDCC